MHAVRFLARKVKLGQLVLQRARNIREHGTDEALCATRANEFTARALSQNRPNGVDQDGFARAGLTRQYGQSRIQLDVRAFYDRDILNVQHP